MRISYEKGGLSEDEFLGADPMEIWDTWFKEAVEGKVSGPGTALPSAKQTWGLPYQFLITRQARKVPQGMISDECAAHSIPRSLLQVCVEPNCISLASADASGRPSVRVVLLKG